MQTEQNLPATPAPAWHYALIMLPLTLYPFILSEFHTYWSQGATGIAFALLFLACAFSPGYLAYFIARNQTWQKGLRRLVLLAIAAPTLFVFLGVETYMLGVPIGDAWLWLGLWILIAIGFWWSDRRSVDTADSIHSLSTWRVAHGIIAVGLVLYVLFHVLNHLFGLGGLALHSEVREIGERVYRAKLIEPLLVLLFFAAAFTGARMLWNYTKQPLDFFRSVQLATGAVLFFFVIGHMNSVFIFARSFLEIPTDWNFAIGAPTGILADSWNIRLFPHYFLGVFYVLTHILSGARVVLIAHGAKENWLNPVWAVFVVLSALTAAVIMFGMVGV